jgi:hypothetical protein
VTGHRVDKILATTVTVKRPNKMRAARAGGVMDQRFFYDGKTITLYNPAEKVYATEAAPDTVERMIDFARETVGVLLPATDLLYRNVFPLLMQDVTLAAVVGDSGRRGQVRSPAVQPAGCRFPDLGCRGQATIPAQICRHRDGYPRTAEHEHGPERLEDRRGRGRRPVHLRAAQGDQRDPFLASRRGRIGRFVGD